jgi:hypothetical protein
MKNKNVLMLALLSILFINPVLAQDQIEVTEFDMPEQAEQGEEITVTIRSKVDNKEVEIMGLNWGEGIQEKSCGEPVYCEREWTFSIDNEGYRSVTATAEDEDGLETSRTELIDITEEDDVGSRVTSMTFSELPDPAELGETYTVNAEAYDSRGNLWSRNLDIYYEYYKNGFKQEEIGSSDCYWNPRLGTERERCSAEGEFEPVEGATANKIVAEIEASDGKLISREESFNVEEAESDFVINDVSIKDEEIEEGESTTFEAEIENEGSADGYSDINWHADDIKVGSKYVNIDAGESRTVTLERDYSELQDSGLEVGESYGVSAEEEVSGDEKDSGQTVTLLEDEADDPANFDVEIDSAEPVTAGETLEVDFTVTNTGDKRDSQYVELKARGERRDREYVSFLDSGESESGTLRWDTEEGDSGYRTIRVNSDDDDASTVVNIKGRDQKDDPAYFDVRSISFDSPVYVDDSVEVDYTVKNTGDSSDRKTVELNVRSESRDTESIRLDPGERKEGTLDFRPEESDTGYRQIFIKTSDDEKSDFIQIKERDQSDGPAYFDVEIDNFDDEVTEGDTVEVDYTVTNTGDQEDFQNIDLRAKGQRQDRDFNVGLEPGESESGTLEWGTEEGDSGYRSISVSSEDDEDSTVVNIRQKDQESEDQAFFDVEIDDYDDEVTEGETVDVDYTVTNTGDQDDIQNIELRARGDRQDRDFNVGLDEGGSKSGTLEWDAESGDSGYRSITVSSEDDEDDEVVEVLDEKDDDEKHRLTVNVKDGSGDRLENAEVEVDGDEKTTNSYGRARFELEDDYYTVEASKSGYDSDSEGVRVDSSDESVTLYLNEKDDFKEYDLDVKVEDQYSNKVENAVVTADGFSDRTDSDGEAYFNNLREGDYRVVASKDGYLPESREINLDRDREITMVLRKSSSEVKAEYDYIPSRPEAGETVEFDATRSGGDVVDYRWSFGDGSSGKGREVEHSYESGGWYSARLTVENSEGDTDSTTRSIYVEEEEQEPGELDVEVEDEENDPLEDARVTAMALSPYNYAVRSSDVDTDSERTSSSKVGDYKLGFDLDEEELQTNAEYSSGYDRASWSGTVLESSDSDRIVVRYDLSADSREGTYRKYEASQDIDLSSGEKEVTMILTVNGDVLEEYTSVIDVPDEHRFEAENKGTGTEYTGRDTRVSTASAPFFSEYTDSDGHAFFEVPDGRYLVTASKPGYTTDRTTINVDEGERREIGLELEDLRDDREDDDDDQDDSDEEQVVMQEVRIPSSVCEGDSLTARIEVENTGEDDLDYTLSATGLGTETDRVYYLDEGESDTKTVAFSNVQGSGNERISFSTGYDSEERTVQVRDCETEESGLSASVTPKQVRIGDSMRVSGIAEGVGSQNIDISIGGRSATSISTEPDGRFSTYIIPNRVGTHQVEVESRDRSSTASVQVLPTVAVNSVGVPNNVFEGEGFEVCGDVESQTAPLVLLKKDGQIIDSKNGRGEICFELNEKPGTYTYEIQALNRGASNTASRTVEVMEQGSEATNFPDQIASVESGSGMVKVELYNNRKELRNYEIELEGLPRTWTAQSRKEVSLNSGERSTEYIYFTPKQEGDYEASLKVRSDGEEIHSETIDISSGGTSETESFWGRFRAFVGLN